MSSAVNSTLTPIMSNIPQMNSKYRNELHGRSSSMNNLKPSLASLNLGYDEVLPVPVIPDKIQDLLKSLEKDSEDNICEKFIPKVKAEPRFKTLFDSHADPDYWKKSTTDLSLLLLKRSASDIDSELLETDHEISLQQQLELNGFLKNIRPYDQLLLLTNAIDQLAVQVKNSLQNLIRAHNTLETAIQTKSGLSRSLIYAWKWMLIACITNVSPDPWESPKIKVQLEQKLKKLESQCGNICFNRIKILVKNLRKLKSEFQKLIIDEVKKSKLFRDNVLKSVKNTEFPPQPNSIMNPEFPVEIPSYSRLQEYGDDGHQLDSNLIELCNLNNSSLSHQKFKTYKGSSNCEKLSVFEGIINEVNKTASYAVSQAQNVVTNSVGSEANKSALEEQSDHDLRPLHNLLKNTAKTWILKKYIVQALLANQLYTIQYGLDEMESTGRKIKNSLKDIYKMIRSLRKNVESIMNGKYVHEVNSIVMEIQSVSLPFKIPGWTLSSFEFVDKRITSTESESKVEPAEFMSSMSPVQIPEWVKK